MEAAAQGMTELAKALVKFQSEMSPIKREAKNPGFKRADGRPSTYADLASTIEAIREPMAECGLAFLQLLGGDPTGITVTTVLMHVSGESVRGTAWSPLAQQTPQAVGSATSYLKRYSLWAILGLATEDDDGQEASRPKKPQLPAPPPKPPVDTSKIVKAFEGYGQTVAMLEQYIGKPLAQATESDVTKLKALYAEKKRLATLDPDAEAKRLEQEKAEKGIADEQAATRAKIDAQMKASEKPADAFAGYVERVRLATTPGTVALVVAEAVSNGIKAGDLKALQRTANDRTLVLNDVLKRARQPAFDPSPDVPL